MDDELASLLAQAATLAAELPVAVMARAEPAKAGAELAIYGAIGWDVTSASVRDALRAVPDDAPLTVAVNSPGGVATEGFAIFNLLAQRKGPVTVRVEGLAASAASYLILAAGRIEMAEASFLMIHNSSAVTMGTKDDHMASAEMLAKVDAMMVRLYARRTGQDPDTIAAMMAAETWLTPDEAMAGGFADALAATPATAHAYSIDARSLLAGFKRLPASLAATALTESNPPHSAVSPPTKESHMAPKDNEPGGVAAPVMQPTAAAPASAPTLPAAATTAELARIAGKANLGVEWIEAQANARASLAEASAAALDAIAVAHAAAVRPSEVQVTRDEGDTRRTALAAALAARTGQRLTASEGQMAGEMRGWSLNDFARAYVEMAGGKVRSAGALTIAQAALGMRGPMASVGMHSTSDFPLLLANTANKSLRQAYDSSPRTFTTFGRQATMPDFKATSRVALGGAPALNQVNEHGEIEFGSVSEAAESYRLFRFGRRVAVTFEAVINDDLSGFTRIPGMFGSAAARLESDTVYGILNANPNMADGVALFASGHSNIGTGVLGVAALGAGRAVMRKQTAPNGDIMNLMPAFLLVPAELETAADSLMVQTVVPSGASTTAVNPLAGRLQVVVEPRLTSALQWYLMADANQIDTIEYAYLAGQEAPQVTSYTDEATDGVIIKCTHSFGAKAIDWRGMYRSSGA
jgi:ATP-dependent protease ClpP protease subunit